MLLFSVKSSDFMPLILVYLFWKLYMAW